VLGLLAIPLLVALNGLFVAAEFSMVAVRRTRVEELVRHGRKGAKTLAGTLDNLSRAIAATQLGVTLASLALGWTAEPALVHLIEPLFDFLPDTWALVTTHTVAVAVAFLLITFMHVVFGELLPKRISLQTPEHTALWTAGPLNLFAKLTRPLIRLMNGTANLLLRWWGYEATAEEALIHSVEELALLVEDTEEAGLLDPDQAEFVQNVFRLSDKRVGDCLVPRERMATLELNTPADKVLEAVRSGAHTRMPVYEKDLDNIVGVVNTKDLFFLFSVQGVVVLHDAMYPALFFKPELSVAEALRQFRKARRPMALVRDEQGKIRGLITLEDILEEIVGDIEDEHDQPRGQPPRWWRHVGNRRGALAPAPRPAAALPAIVPNSPPAGPPGAKPQSTSTRTR
jgi:CBS domain containing-hemolysin-like protein